MPSVIATITAMPASAASMIASAAPGGGTKIIVALAPVALTASAQVSKTGTPSVVVAAPAGRDAADQVRAVGLALLGVKRPRLAGDALADQPRVLVDQNAHNAILSGRGLLTGVSSVSSSMIVAATVARIADQACLADVDDEVEISSGIWPISTGIVGLPNVGDAISALDRQRTSSYPTFDRGHCFGATISGSLSRQSGVVKKLFGVDALATRSTGTRSTSSRSTTVVAPTTAVYFALMVRPGSRSSPRSRLAHRRRFHRGLRRSLSCSSAHAAPLAAATTFWAASVRPSAVMILRPLSSRSFLPSSTLVPSSRTTSGTRKSISS